MCRWNVINGDAPFIDVVFCIAIVSISCSVCILIYNVVDTISNIYPFDVSFWIQIKLHITSCFLKFRKLWLQVNLTLNILEFKEGLIFQVFNLLEYSDLRVDKNFHVFRSFRSLNLQFFLSVKDLQMNGNVYVYKEFSCVLGGLRPICLLDLGLCLLFFLAQFFF